ncbi:MAG: hypothetical protein DRJ14_01085 [Acidobacteria bacterium]|nr:MAG: hypothetical protein DRJ14_01085 [Acidobacteriota bacterium]
MGRTEKAAITPDTKVGSLLDNFPELEPVLMALSPKFEKLKNPVLRKTVAKVATLRQVAKVGAVPLPLLINELRRAAGMEDLELDTVNPADIAVPSWLNGARPVEAIDIRDDIDAGVQPISIVMKKLNTLNEGEILKVIAPFEPVPLIDLAKKKGFAVHLDKENDTGFMAVYFRKSE